MYSSVDILNAMRDGRIKISEFDMSRLNPNSYDLRLGNWFYHVQWYDLYPVFRGPVWIDDGDIVRIPPGSTCLGMTKDIVGTFHNVTGKLYSRSTTGRTGFATCRDAGLGDVGYNNHWTLEITSYIDHYSQGMPCLVVGEPICQIAFYEVKTPPDNSYKGQYVSTDWPDCMIPKKYRGDSRYVKSA